MHVAAFMMGAAACMPCWFSVCSIVACSAAAAVLVSVHRRSARHLNYNVLAFCVCSAAACIQVCFEEAAADDEDAPSAALLSTL